MPAPERPLRPKEALRLLNHGPVVLVSACAGKKDGIITVAWATPASAVPPLVAVSVSPLRHTHGLIRRSRQFVVNIPDARLFRAVWLCGTLSGRDVDKFAASGLTRAAGTAVSAPRVAECFAHLECRVTKAVTAGDHTVFVGEVLAASVAPAAFDGCLSLRAGSQTLHHLGGSRFVTSGGRRIDAGRAMARGRRHESRKQV